MQITKEAGCLAFYSENILCRSASPDALKPKCGTSQKDYRLRKFQRQILSSFELSVYDCCVCAGISNLLKHTVECEVQICEREFFVQRIKLFTLSLLGSHYSLAHTLSLPRPPYRYFIDVLLAERRILFLHLLPHAKCKLWALHHADASVILIICTQHSHAHTLTRRWRRRRQHHL